MIKNFKLTPLILLFVVCFLLSPVATIAQVKSNIPEKSSSVGIDNNKGGIFSLQNPLKVDSIGGLVEASVQAFTFLVVILAVLALVYVGLRYILARGNPEEIKKMSAWLLCIVIGVAIVIGARIIVSIVINTLGATGVVDPGIIQSANKTLEGK